MDKEIAWMFAPVAALLSQIGGTWWKPARRFILPIGLALTLIWCQIAWWKAVLCGISVCVVACLPFTIGKEWKAWYQWVWVWFLGYLLGVGSAMLNQSGFLLALVPCVAFGSLGILSNLPATAKLVPWKWFEGIVWMVGMYPYLLIASS
jgi:hypothetical protein